jgi:Mrp family chromosome partitioning ATPase
MISQNGGRALLINAGQQIQTPDAITTAPMQRGFTDMLFGNAGAGEVIRRDPAMEIDMISAGSISGKALERDDVTRLYAILSQLRKDYDLVVLDSAPLTSAPDGVMLSEVADEAIFICRWQHSAPLAVTTAIDRLRAQGATVAGIVVAMKHADFTIASDGKTRGREQALITQLYGA